MRDDVGVLEDSDDEFVISAHDLARTNTRDDDVRDDADHDDLAHKGDVVDVRLSRIGARDAIDIVGLPCTLVVENGAPRIEP